MPTVVLLAAATCAPWTTASVADTPPNPDWQQFRYDETHTGFNPAETVIGAANVDSLSLQWAKAPAQGDPLVANGKVYSCTAQACTSRVLTDGAQHWRTRQIGASSISVGNDRFYAVGGKAHVVDVLDVGTGALQRILRVTFGFRTPVTYHAGSLFVTAGYHGHAYALDPVDGSVVWKSAKGFALRDYYNSGPTIAHNTFYAAACEHLIALREDTGRFRWATSLPGATPLLCGGLPAVADGQVVLTTTAVDAFDASTGALLWTTPGDGGQLTTPALAYGRAYVVAPAAGTLSAYSTADGSRAWTAEVGSATPTSVPTVANGLVYVATAAGLRAFDAADGTPVATVDGSFSGEPVVSGGWLVVDCADSPVGAGLCAYRPDR